MERGSDDREATFQLEHVRRGGGTVPSVHYALSLIGECADSWMFLSHSNGVLEKFHDSHTVTVRVQPRDVGIHTAFIVVECPEHPMDLMTVQVSVELIGSLPAKLFSVICNAAAVPDERSSIISLGDVYYNHMHHDRSFNIVNNTNRALEFILKSDVPDGDDTELVFSLSRRSPRLLTHTVVDAHAECRIVVFYKPVPMVPPEVVSLETAEEKEVEVYVSCRSVKNYHKVIRLQATCRYPQLECTPVDCVFRGDRSSLREGQAITFHHPQHTLRIQNRFHTLPLQYTIHNSSRFVTISAQSDSPGECEPGGEQLFLILPNMESINAERHHILQNRYLEEHITVYNENRLSESEVIRIRFSFGEFNDFYCSPSPRLVHNVRVLQDQVVGFLKHFCSAWDEACAAASVSAIGSGPSQRSVSAEEAQQWSSAIARVQNNRSLYCEYFVIVDQLVYFGLMKHVGSFSFPIAVLLFSKLLDLPFFHACRISSPECPEELPQRGESAHEGDGLHVTAELSSSPAPPPILVPLGATAERKWLDRLEHYVSHFPRVSHVQPLHALLHTLLRPFAAER
eukprot:TRINITY_DN15939_c0_g1_i1.p1 TRINITY_DN15939_c0_g1~~TRINITY_DN15939_c0_g1_i1.p1  ORF type:complete len:569 (-),score=181.50 TRINITY_DN15939_c0_g1_i1:83-1789(-)